ncbi:MAG: hypothetical protein UU09_C0020G0006 [Microgenomates group bacterium GW2011_GWA2_40_6]|nr:MAG: hypothetical protein UU09_C0020G0006 [Microgenomates group bacterium GW2011_GWA2_40_6]
MTSSLYNTKKRGLLRFFLYREAKHYVGVCLDLDLVEFGDNLQELQKSICEAAQAHVDAVIKNNLSDDLLNKPAPIKYWKKLDEYTRKVRNISRLTKVEPKKFIFTQLTDGYEGGKFVAASC